MTLERRACDDWPRVLNPARGCLPLAAAPRTNERVLLCTIQADWEPMRPLARALEDACGLVLPIDWRSVRGGSIRVRSLVLADAARLRPTIVFLRMQRGGTPITPEFITDLRHVCHPDAVIVHWNGDVYERVPQWMVDLGQVCDATLVPTTADAEAYARQGVKHPGYLASGVDEQTYNRSRAFISHELVLLANNHSHVPGYARRLEITRRLRQTYGARVALYGRRWEGSEFASWARPFVMLETEAATNAGAAAVVCMSLHHDLERYTSDRLFRALASGSLCLVEEFPDYKGIGLGHGINCAVWRDWDSLRPLVDVALGEGYPRADEIRAGALELAQFHTWRARALELLACVDAVRAERGQV